MTDRVYLSALEPDPQDPRDFLYEYDVSAALPQSANLTRYCGRIDDQLSIGSCTANAMANAAEMFLTGAATPTDLSRLFNYYTSRELLGVQDRDGGSTARMALRAAAKLGLPPEADWPYVVERVGDRPDARAYAEAGERRVGRYERIPVTIPGGIARAAKHALSQGWPVYVSMRVGTALRDLPAGKVYRFINAPANPYWGNHAVVLVGYDGDVGTIENSWGSSWCEGGFFRMLLGVLEVDLIDVWVVRGFANIARVGEPAGPPAMDWRAQLEQLYPALLGRPGDPDGIAWWTRQLNAGMHFREVVARFADSDEFRARYPG